jgi:hypothetical protein
MSKQTQSYLEDMQKMYEVIMKKCVDNAELTSTDKLFLELYNKTIGKEKI